MRKLTWPNGTVATLYSAAEPESLRGPQHDFTWADEIAKWPMGIDGMRVRNVATDSDLVWTGTQWKVPPVMAAPQSGAVIDTEARTVIEALLVHFRAIGLLAP